MGLSVESEWEFAPRHFCPSRRPKPQKPNETVRARTCEPDWAERSGLDDEVGKWSSYQNLICFPRAQPNPRPLLRQVSHLQGHGQTSLNFHFELERDRPFIFFAGLKDVWKYRGLPMKPETWLPIRPGTWCPIRPHIPKFERQWLLISPHTKWKVSFFIGSFLYWHMYFKK